MNQILLLVIFVLLSAFFSLSETALTAIGKIKVKRLFSQGVFGAKALYNLRENPNKMLSTILVGNSLVMVAATALATSVFIDVLAKKGLTGESMAIFIATIVMTAVILVFGEITPKTIAIKNADKLACVVAPAIELFALILTPVLMLLNWMCKPIIKLFGGDIKANVPFVTEEELKMLLSVSEEEGVLESEEKEMIHSIFEFGDSVAKEVMVPRPDMFCLDVNTPVDTAMARIVEEGHSRIPVFEESVDNIIGIVFVKDLLPLCVEKKSISLRDILRPALFVPETKKLDDLMRHMQSMRSHIAIVVDEYGGVAGLLSLEDLLEEIVGEIKDEFDTEEKEVEILPDGSALVDARLPVKDVNEKIGTSIPEGDYDTISGFVLSLIGKLPSIGDTFRYEDLRIVIEKVSKRRITRIKISKIKNMEAEGKGIVGG